MRKERWSSCKRRGSWRRASPSRLRFVTCTTRPGGLRIGSEGTGPDTRAAPPLPLLLPGGAVLVLAGRARQAFHGVPCVLVPPSLQLKGRSPKRQKMQATPLAWVYQPWLDARQAAEGDWEKERDAIRYLLTRARVSFSIRSVCSDSEQERADRSERVSDSDPMDEPLQNYLVYLAGALAVLTSLVFAYKMSPWGRGQPLWPDTKLRPLNWEMTLDVASVWRAQLAAALMKHSRTQAKGLEFLQKPSLLPEGFPSFSGTDLEDAFKRCVPMWERNQEKDIEELVQSVQDKSASTMEADDRFRHLQQKRRRFPALLLPKPQVARALEAKTNGTREGEALNSCEPRWGTLLAKTLSRGQSCSKGVHLVDYLDDSELALRAIELPEPLASLAARHLAGEAEPSTVGRLLAQGARFEPCFQQLPDLEDLHPCPPALVASTPPLPAMNAPEDFGQAIQRRRRGFSFVELFAGVGGFRLALEALGGRCLLASELHPTARQIYLDNWPGPLGGDVRLIEDVPDHDLLVGGFPCQPFSSLGQQPGLADHRGRLFLHICRVLRHKRPKAALLENVPGILSCDEGKAKDEVLLGLEQSGYRVAHRTLDSSFVLPQRRRRVYFVAIRMDLPACERFRFPWLPQLRRPVREILEPLSPQQQEALTVSEKYWAKLSTSRCFQERPQDIVARLDEPAAPLISAYGSTRSAGSYAAVTQFVPQEGQRPRLLSQRECARLQGFPEGYRLDHCQDKHMAWFRAIGNAVSVPIVAAVADALLAALEGSVGFGAGAALRCALDACPAEAKSQLLDRQVRLPNGELRKVGQLLAPREPCWSCLAWAA
ncbi:unnamed protein product [Effrenium voratum]|nr:unnamed protein product [Effrenium voratum]